MFCEDENDKNLSTYIYKGSITIYRNVKVDFIYGILEKKL